MTDSRAILGQAGALFASGRPTEAISLLERASKRGQQDPSLDQTLASMLASTGQLERALFFAERATAGAPRSATALQLLASIRAATGRLRDAEGAARKALAIDESSFGALNTLGIVLSQTGRQHEAADAFAKAIALHPSRRECVANYAFLLVQLGRVDEAVRLPFITDPSSSQDFALASARAFIMNYPSGLDPTEVLQSHVQFGSAMMAAAASASRSLGPLPPKIPQDHRPLVLGYMSSDFRSHSVSSFVEHLIERHDRSRFRVNLYHTHHQVDDLTQRFRSKCDEFHHVHALDDAALARRIRENRVDILIDLNGLTAHHRAAVLAIQAAPVQVTYCGYCNTTGLPTVNARIVDSITDPPGAGADALSVEPLVRLSRCFLCYRPPQECPPATTDESLNDSNHVRFASFNSPAKISEQTIDLWAAVLNAAPQSSLMIKGVGLQEAAARDLLVRRFEKRGTDPSRLELYGPNASSFEHLDQYRRVHIALDTTPYSGTTTTCEALWMGVPVVTLRGSVHASRVSASILTAIGREDWIAKDAAEYVRIARDLAQDQQKRATLRRTLRETVERSSLRDEAGHARMMEQAYQTLWDLDQETASRG
ncbi:MAG: tetratricopeptide repeat protein [Phycisphaeraceae bacterium]|nr:tetratricopeptide repeat protein [Phycisphaeraceae bacterium]MBX3366156.1 tetratricopeptide repeat protein [Phycisphaeraceae bacterium]